jgi:hypothetical protein
MTGICWKSAVTWSLLGLMLLLFALMWGPAPALAKKLSGADMALYEVTEDMYLTVRAADGNILSYVSDPSKATHRQAVAQLAGSAQFGTPLCPAWVATITTAKQCTINAKGADNLSLATGKGTLSGSYAVVVQGDNDVDAPEFVVMTGTFTGDADLSMAMSGQAPLGFITNGVVTIDGYDGAAFKFTGTFRLPFALDKSGKYIRARSGNDAFYLSDHGRLMRIKDGERSLGVPTVRLEIEF